jgi:hypothetical protein
VGRYQWGQLPSRGKRLGLFLIDEKECGTSHG